MKNLRKTLFGVIGICLLIGMAFGVTLWYYRSQELEWNIKVIGINAVTTSASDITQTAYDNYVNKVAATTMYPWGTTSTYAINVSSVDLAILAENFYDLVMNLSWTVDPAIASTVKIQAYMAWTQRTIYSGTGQGIAFFNDAGTPMFWSGGGTPTIPDWTYAQVTGFRNITSAVLINGSPQVGGGTDAINIGGTHTNAVAGETVILGTEKLKMYYGAPVAVAFNGNPSFDNCNGVQIFFVINTEFCAFGNYDAQTVTIGLGGIPS